MKLSEYRDEYAWFSGKASDVSRSLSFAGIAVIWIFKQQNGVSLSIPVHFLPPLGLFIASLTCDLLQYVSGALVWGCFHRYHEKRLSDVAEDPDLDAPRYANWLQNSFFAMKLLVLAVAYVWLLVILSREIL